MDRGRETHGEASSADAHSGVNIQLYNAGGGTVTLGATEILAVTDLTIVSVPGGAVSLKSINASGTVTLFAGTVAANGGLSRPFHTPVYGRRGGTLTLTAPAGQVDCQLEGFVIH